METGLGRDSGELLGWPPRACAAAGLSDHRNTMYRLKKRGVFSVSNHIWFVQLWFQSKMFSQISDYMHFITGDWISNKCSAIIHTAEIHREQRGTVPYHRSRKPVPNHFSSLCRWDVQTARRGVWEREQSEKPDWGVCVCVFVERDWEEKRTDVNSQLVSHRFPDWRLSIQWAASGGRREKEKTERPNRTTIVPIQYTGKPKIRACEGRITHILVGKAVLSSHVCIVVILHLHYIL